MAEPLPLPRKASDGTSWCPWHKGYIPADEPVVLIRHGTTRTQACVDCDWRTHDELPPPPAGAAL